MLRVPNCPATYKFDRSRPENIELEEEKEGQKSIMGGSIVIILQKEVILAGLCESHVDII